MEKMRYGVFGFQQTDREKIDRTVVKDGDRVVFEVGEYRSDDWGRYQETVQQGEVWLNANIPDWRDLTL